MVISAIYGKQTPQQRQDLLRDEVSFNILLTCHQIYEEAAIPFCYRIAILCFERPLDFANDFLRHLEPSNIGRLQNLRFDFYHPAKAQVWRRAPAATLSRYHQLSTMFHYYPELSNVKNLTLELTQPCFGKTSTALRARGSKSDQRLAEAPPIVLVDSGVDDHARNDYWTWGRSYEAIALWKAAARIKGKYLKGATIHRKVTDREGSSEPGCNMVRFYTMKLVSI